jgi:hypothetical protein
MVPEMSTLQTSWVDCWAGRPVARILRGISTDSWYGQLLFMSLCSPAWKPLSEVKMTRRSRATRDLLGPSYEPGHPVIGIISILELLTHPLLGL